jgi:alpha-ketoglutarate-dependent taurine dioxygenase
MSNSNPKKKRFANFLDKKATRNEIQLPGVTIDMPADERCYPVIIRPASGVTDFTKWLNDNRSEVDHLLQKYGALLFRDFNIFEVSDFRKAAEYFSRTIIEYTNRSSPRSEIGEKVYTSTDHPKDQIINMHNELSYAREWPQKIMFFCKTPSSSGGETPIADNRNMLAYLSPETKDKFMNLGVKYMRNLGNGLGLHWKEVFQTEDKKEIEQECKIKGMELEWKENDIMTLSWKKDAFITHPLTRELLWFNHAYFFNELTLGSLVLNTLKADEIPFNTYYGNGQVIEPRVIEEIDAAYKKTIRTFNWQKGDMIVLDNLIMSHGRYAYTGEREIAVIMSDMMP